MAYRESVPGTAIRVRDGHEERVPFSELQLGDFVMDEGNGRVCKITTTKKTIGEISRGRFQFSHHNGKGAWFEAWEHGATFYSEVFPPDKPFGVRTSKHHIAWSEAEVDVLTFEEVKTAI